MRLFLAEKPTLAKTLAQSLGFLRKTNGFIECENDTIVTWCFGHLLEMAQPEAYDPAWVHRYDRRLLPIVPHDIRLVPRDAPGVRAQLQCIADLLTQSSLVVNAGDPDREGQLLVDEVLEYLHYTGPTQRIFLASLDPTSIAKALAHLEDNQKYRPWRDAAQTRRTVDWLGGINMSRAMTIFGNSLGLDGVLSLGRVQTPTLRIVVDRERQIANFTPVAYAQLVAHIAHAKGNFTAVFQPSEDTLGLDPDGRLIDFDIAKNIQNNSKNRPGIIENCERKTVKEAAKLPYSLASLQSDMGAKYNLGAQQVLDIAQKLYESQLTTYPRTDCEYLPEEQFGQAKEVLDKLSPLPDLDAAIKGADPSLHSKAWNTAKITAHHAIIPTGILPKNLSHEEKQVYLAIAIRYILQFWPPYEYEATKIRVLLENNTHWDATGKCIKKPGWTAIVRPDKEAEPDLPRVAKKDPVQAGEVDLNTKHTTPPAHFTEGTLINAMKNIHRFVDDKAAQAKLRETSGLGTEATRAAILEILKKRDYITKKGKSLRATSKGENVIDLCPHSMKDIVTTATLEDKLSDVQAGKVATEAVIADYVATLAPMIDAVFAQKNITLPDVTFEPCPCCSKALKRLMSKKNNSMIWVCLSCHASFMDANGKVGDRLVHGEISQTHVCPLCGKAIVKHARKDGSGFFWGCSGYPNCPWNAPDDNGKPGVSERTYSKEHRCPQCGKILARIKRRDGSGFFWSCTGYPDCRWSAPDEDGKPGTPTKTVSSTLTCPLCNKPIARIKRRDGSGFFWSCTGYPDCRWSANDEDGVPNTKTHAAKKTPPDTSQTSTQWQCPVCASPLEARRSQTGSIYWLCTKQEAHNPKRPLTFPSDDAGNPILNQQ